MKKKLARDNDSSLRKTLAPKAKTNFRARQEQFSKIKPLAKGTVLHINYSDKAMD